VPLAKEDSLSVMGKYINIQPLLLEIKSKESELRTQEREWALVLGRLADLEVSAATKAMFQRFVDGELTIEQLDAAIDEYLDTKGKS